VEEKQATFFAIGDPGRAALELPDGPPTARIGVADVELSAASLPGMLIRGASVRGLQHRARGKVRQDSFALGHRADEAVAVVCDGVGSLGRSDEAAALVSRRLAEYGASGLPWPDAVAHANEELSKLARETGAAVPPGNSHDDAMATTVVAVSVRREAGEWVGEVAWVGDSALWHLSGSGTWTPLTTSHLDGAEADYHSSGVKPLPSADGACTWCGFRIRGGALFVMTDGVANPLRWSRDVQNVLAAWWLRPPDPFAFASQVGFARKSHLDDRTVVGIWADGGDQDTDPESEPRDAIVPG